MDEAYTSLKAMNDASSICFEQPGLFAETTFFPKSSWIGNNRAELVVIMNIGGHLKDMF